MSQTDLWVASTWCLSLIYFFKGLLIYLLTNTCNLQKIVLKVIFLCFCCIGILRFWCCRIVGLCCCHIAVAAAEYIFHWHLDIWLALDSDFWVSLLIRCCVPLFLIFSLLFWSLWLGFLEASVTSNLFGECPSWGCFLVVCLFHGASGGSQFNIYISVLTQGFNIYISVLDTNSIKKDIHDFFLVYCCRSLYHNYSPPHTIDDFHGL